VNAPVTVEQNGTEEAVGRTSANMSRIRLRNGST
jgi:hypothetical protein